MHIKKQIQALLIAFGIVAMLFICIVVVGSIIIGQAMRANKLIEHTARVNSQIGAIRTLFNKADIVAREKWVYNQNGDKIAPARLELKQEIETLREIVSDNPNQTKNITKAEETLLNYFNLQDELIKTAESSGYDVASRIARDRNSAALNLDVGNAFTMLQAEETSLLGERSRSAESANSSLILILVLLAIAMFVAIPGSFMVAYMTLNERFLIAEDFRAKMIAAKDEKTNTIVLPGDYGVEVLAALESTTPATVHKSFA